MKSFSKEDIDKWRKEFGSLGRGYSIWVSNKKYQKWMTNFNEESIEYFQLPVALFQGIPNGLFRMTGSPKDGYIVGVSTDLPDELRAPFAFSEYNEFMNYGFEDGDRTLHTEQDMVNALEGELKNSYIEKKIVLYDYMLENSKDNLETWGFVQKDYDGFQRARDFLETSKR